MRQTPIVSVVSIIMNPSAAGGRTGRALPDVRSRLEALGVEHHVEATRSLDHARELARAAVAGGEVAAGFGGDGLIGAVAGELVGTEGVLGVLPGGRGNDFARTLGIPGTPVEACDVLARGQTRRVDLGRAGERTFLGIASCGFDSEANRIANAAKVVRGNLVYTYGALRALAGWRPARFEVELETGERRTLTGYSVAAANAKAYGGGMLLAPGASLSDGLLDVVMISEISKLRFLRLLPTVFDGTHTRQPNVEIVRTRRVTVRADRPFTLYADGDPLAELPVTIEALPAAVQVLAPPS
jgi:YegS/Rv2252/BmrU family lipid kinase